jgi:CRISPR-associated protein Csd1
MYEPQRVRYLIDLDDCGRLLNIVDLATEGRGPEARGRLMVAPSVARTVAVRANLLMDNGEYALGIRREGSPPAKVQQRHQAFVDQVRRCATATVLPEVRAVQLFLDKLTRTGFPYPEKVRAADNVTFRVGGILPIDLPAVRTYWAGNDEAGGPVMNCLLCGQLRPVLRRIPFKHKNIPGGQVSGTALISANSDAFESYGLIESLIAPVCRECAEAFSKGLNALIAGPSTHLRRDPLLYVYWTREPGFSPLSFLETAEPDQVKELLRVVDTARTGSIEALSREQFYALSLNGSGGRLAVRDWLDMTVGEAQQHLARFFRLQQIADLYHPDLLQPLPVWRLSRATVRDPRRDNPAPGIASALYRVALAGGAVPLDVLFGVIRRFRAEQHVTPERAALVKLVLSSQGDSPWREEQMSSLERGERNPAYLCGRLLAVLEDAQRQALGDPGATIVDRFYGTASSAPVAVFGRLIRGAQPHLARLRRDRPGAYRALQREIEEILSGLPLHGDGTAFPTVLNLRDQGIFALGYYHQRAARFARHTTQPQAEPEFVPAAS